MSFKRAYRTTLAIFGARRTRAVARAMFALGFAATMLHGVSRSGAFEDEASVWSKLPGRVASLVGLAADHIQITGLNQHEPDEVLAALSLKPGKSIVGFDASVARQTLQALPWVKIASVEREYPNMLKITVKERVAIALWQHDHQIEMIDDTGVAMGQPHFLLANHLPLVTGEEANLAAADLLNDLSAIPGLSEKISAAARVGKRRWTLYFANGVKVALPENGVRPALQAVWNLDQQQAILSKGISMIDMRLPGQMTVQVSEAEVPPGKPGSETGSKN